MNFDRTFHEKMIFSMSTAPAPAVSHSESLHLSLKSNFKTLVQNQTVIQTAENWFYHQTGMGLNLA